MSIPSVFCPLILGVLAGNLLILPLIGAPAIPGSSPIVVNRPGETIALEPYGPNIIRISLSKDQSEALAAPGYGFVAAPVAQGWSHESDAGGENYTSERLNVQVFGRGSGPRRAGLPTQTDISRYFGGSAPGAHIKVSTPDGRTLVDMTGWAMAEPNYKDGTANVLHEKRPSDKPFFTVGATFVAPDDEHYYGLGQNQEGFLDPAGSHHSILARLQCGGGCQCGCPFHRHQ